MRKRLLRSDFNRNVLTLFSGTTIAQIIPIVITPILTRIYSPEDFGVFALYTAIVAILSVLATGRYELAILIPKKKEDAINIGALAIILSLIFSFLLTFFLFLFSDNIKEIFKVEQVGNWIYLVPLSILILSVYQVIYSLLNREKHYKQMSFNKVIQQASIGSSNIGIGFINKSIGLIVGTLIGQFVSLVLIIKKIFKNNEIKLGKVTVQEMKRQGKRYINFPKYLTMAHVLNVSASNLATILFTKFFTSTAVGHFSMTQRILRMPLSVVGSAISDVFRQRAAEELNTKGNCKSLYLKTLLTLFSLSFVPFIVLFLISPTLFSFIFGTEWRVAGEYARYLIPMLFLQFVTSPLSSLFMILEKQKMDLLWQVMLFILTTVGILVGYFIFNSVKVSIILYSVAYSVMYILNGLLTFKFSVVGKEIIHGGEDR